tara:strand:+ start:561 stop:689 length:129 start_codon:yes stop_codon:yes gene_type:complete
MKLLIDLGKKMVYGLGFGTGMSIPYYFMTDKNKTIKNKKNCK